MEDLTKKLEASDDDNVLEAWSNTYSSYGKSAWIRTEYKLVVEYVDKADHFKFTVSKRNRPHDEIMALSPIGIESIEDEFYPFVDDTNKRLFG